MSYTGGHYHRRWSASTANNDHKSTPSASSLTSAVEPSTYGTSWNSVRWNKPSTTGYRSQSSSIAARFEKKPSYYISSSATKSPTSSRYESGISSAARQAADISSLGPSVSQRASRFDSNVRDKDKYRSEARELINKWTSRERTSGGYFSRHFEPGKLNVTESTPAKSAPTPTYSAPSYSATKPSEYSSYRKATSTTPIRTTLPSSSRYSVERASIFSPSPTPQSHTLRMERPWRQRMAESSRIRAVHGDDYRSRQSSAESSVYGPSSRFTSLYAPSYMRQAEDEAKTTKYMSRSYSPIRTPVDLFKVSSASRVSSLSKPVELRSISPSVRSSGESLNDKEKPPQSQTVSAVPKNPTIRESSKERENERRMRSSKERTARRNSRQRSQNLNSSSSEEDVNRTRSDSRRRRKKKKSDATDPTIPPKNIMQSSTYDTGVEEFKDASEKVLVDSRPIGLSRAGSFMGESDGFHSCAASPIGSPLMGQRLIRSGSKTQVIRTPSLVEVHGLSKSDSKSMIKTDYVSITPIAQLTDFTEMEECLDSQQESDLSSMQDDGAYSAVAHFKPFKPKVKRIAPVPGVWKKDNVDNISKNKAFIRDPFFGNAVTVWSVVAREIVVHHVKIPTKTELSKDKKATPNEEQKIDATSKSKKLFLKKTKKTVLEKLGINGKSIEEKEKEKEKEPIQEEKKPTPKEKEPTIVEKKPVSEEKKVIEEKKPTPEVKKPIEEKKPIPEVKKPTPVEEKSVAVTMKNKNQEANAKAEKRVAHKLGTSESKSVKATSEVTSSINETIAKPPTTGSMRKFMKTKRKEAAKFRCSSCTENKIVADCALQKKSSTFGAQVIVDTPKKDVNISKAKLDVKLEDDTLKQKKRLGLEFEKARLKALQSADDLQSFLLSNRNLNRDLDEEDSQGLILPDKSILEEYVRRKRGKLERLHSEPIAERDESISRPDSPCMSTTSELLPACTVRVTQVSPGRDPHRTSSTEPRMLDTQSYNNFNSTPQGFHRYNNRVQPIKPIVFDAPKTPFEERLQMQANAIRNANTINLSAHSEMDNYNREVSPRRLSHPTEGMSSLSSAFTAALAANAVPGRHERYAAHIPVNRGEGSGRQSAASIDSTQSVVLDAATKQLDQVIDQARHKHHQHRSKFKEAIDYLDQIFEDLKKECDLNAEDKNNNSRDLDPSVNEVPASVIHHTNSLPNRASRHSKPAQHQSPVELVIPSLPTPPEVAISETFSLPKKTDKLDFTRRWLQDDLSSLAMPPSSPVVIGPEISYNDCDEHSLGSCSAEVAAINYNNKKEKSRKSSVPNKPKSATKQPQPQAAPVRPQPFRPQPIYAVPSSSEMSNKYQELEAPSIPRVASYDQMTGRRSNQGSDAYRANSQEPYQTLASVRSEDASRPSPSAFQNVFANRGSLRGSLRSLPDASIVKVKPYQAVPKDPVLAIDQLVAELELNTDQQMSTADKRRSFPTSFSRVAEYEPTRHRAEIRKPTAKGGKALYTAYNSDTSGYQAGPSNNSGQNIPSFQIHAAQAAQARQQKSLDEVTHMLNSVVNDFPTVQTAFRKKSYPGTSNLHNQSNPFETINQEKINPSRVEAMHNMFERGPVIPQNSQAWKSQQQQSPHKPMYREEDNYYEINEFQNRPSYMRVSPAHHITQRSPVKEANLPSHNNDYHPAYITSQPPSHPPGQRNGSATSSQNGGYYSSNSSGVGQPYQHQSLRRGSIVGKHSVSSRAQSVDDEDDGFYDNIGTYDDRRYSRGSELDAASISSRQLPPKNKIGSFFRKISSSRPPGSAASLVSLNKMGTETQIKHGNLIKSNSLSTEPWKKQVLDAPRGSSKESSSGKHGGGLGTRLRNSIFGSKKRLDG